MLLPVYSLITGDLRTAAGCPLFDYFFGVIMNNFKKKIKRILRRMLGRPEPPKRKTPDRLPDDIDTAVRKNGLETDGFIRVVESDMDFDGCYLTAWTALDDKGIYFILGDEKVTKKRGNKKIKSEYELREIRSYPLSDFDSLKCEQYVSTGRLIAEKDGDDIGLIKFSLNFLGGYDELCKAFNSLKTGEPMPQSSEKPSGGVCPKCKRPYPTGRSSCPKCDKNDSTVKLLFSFFGGYKLQMALIVTAILISTAMNMAMPQISTKTLFDDVLSKVGSTPAQQLLVTLGYLIGAVVGMKLLGLLMTVSFQFLMGSIMPRVIYDIKVKIFAAMQRLSVGFYSSKQTGSLMERVTRDSNNIYWFFVDGLPYVITNVITVIGVLIIMFVMSWKLALLCCAAAPIFLVLLVFGGRFFRTLHHRSWARNARLTSMVSDNINGQRIIKAFSKEDEELDRFDTVSSDLYEADLKLNNSEATLFPVLTILLSVLAVVMLTFGGLMVANGEMTVGTLLNFTVYLTMLVGPLDFLSWVSNWWARCVDSAQRVFEIVDAKPEIVEKEHPIEIDKVRGDIEISKLEFEYEPAQPVIKNLDLKVNVGQMLGIVGKTGAGKTTIANLIARLYDPKAGCVKIDGVDARDLPLDTIRKNVGLVSQDIYLFIGTIADNIRYAKPDATMDEIIAAAKAASAHDFIMKLPDAYETRVGAGGHDLSGGERQRISIARTIIQNPRILILDEATAAMDTETERNIQYSLTKLMQGRTTVAIAHRLSTLRDADMLAVISEGEVVEYGSYAELLKKRGEFYKLYKIQAEALKAVGIID
ncbi:MAG TPA: ABC transporter ATP-binding protein [Ruminococcaceae bacterium]|nr:ABC transporter ATP-binding protein [Oscillospiraceae bacterium]